MTATPEFEAKVQAKVDQIEQAAQLAQLERIATSHGLHIRLVTPPPAYAIVSYTGEILFGNGGGASLDEIADVFKRAKDNAAKLVHKEVEDFVARKVASGELIRLEGNRVIESHLYDPEKHGPRAECRDINCGLTDRTVAHVDH